MLPAQPAPDLRALGVAARIIDARCRLLGLIGPARFCGPDRVDNPSAPVVLPAVEPHADTSSWRGMALTCTARPRQSSPDRVTNPAFCPPDLKTFWDRRDDLYQVGLPAWTLLSGEVHHGGVKKPAVNVLAKKDGVLRDGHQDGNRRQVAALRARRRHAGSARRMTPRGHHGARAACALLLRRAAQTALRSACPQTAASRPSQPRGGEVLGRGRATHREGRCQHQHTYGREPQYSLLARQCGLWAAAMPLLSALPGGWAGRGWRRGSRRYCGRRTT